MFLIFVLWSFVTSFWGLEAYAEMFSVLDILSSGVSIQLMSLSKAFLIAVIVIFVEFPFFSYDFQVPA